MKLMSKPIVVICSSANFYKHAVKIQKELEAHGFKVIVPHTAEKMKKSGNYDAAHYRIWLKDAKNYDRKTWLMREHFKEVASGDVVLVINNEKHGKPNYIGGNVLMEMALAFYLEKPIYLLNGIPEESFFLEEIIGLGSIPLKGNINKFVEKISAS